MEIVYEPHKVIPLADFHAELRFEFPDLPGQLFDYYLVKAARKMAEDGNLIRRRTYIKVEPCVTRYRLPAPDDMEIVGILGITAEMPCAAHVAVSRQFDAPVDTRFERTLEAAWYDDIEQTLNMKSPRAPGRYRISLSVRPKRDACSLPSEYLDNYLETLLTGTRAYVLLITGRPWSNLQLGNAYLREFSQMIGKDSVEKHAHNQRGSIRMRFGRAL